MYSVRCFHFDAPKMVFPYVCQFLASFVKVSVRYLYIEVSSCSVNAYKRTCCADNYGLAGISELYINAYVFLLAYAYIPFGNFTVNLLPSF